MKKKKKWYLLTVYQPFAEYTYKCIYLYFFKVRYLHAFSDRLTTRHMKGLKPIYNPFQGFSCKQYYTALKPTSPSLATLRLLNFFNNKHQSIK